MYDLIASIYSYIYKKKCCVPMKTWIFGCGCGVNIIHSCALIWVRKNNYEIIKEKQKRSFD